MYDTESVATLGKMIRAVRIHAGLTQADATALCGVSAPFLNGVERGKQTARIGGIFSICQGLGIQNPFGPSCLCRGAARDAHPKAAEPFDVRRSLAVLV